MIHPRILLFAFASIFFVSCQKTTDFALPPVSQENMDTYDGTTAGRGFRRQLLAGTNRYNEYWTGNLPIILSAPHGGSLKPAALPDRTCAACVTTQDLNTKELLRLVDSVFTARTGCYVHSVFTNLHRVKIDNNRSLPEATDGNSATLPYYTEYHKYMTTAQNAVMKKYGRGLVIDIHGHGHTLQRVELGYLLSDAQLRQSDATFSTLANSSSIRRLSQIAIGNPGFLSLIRGTAALGTRLGNAGYPTVPSQQIPYPLETEPYFSGGYITSTYGSLSNLKTDAIQVECNFTNVRDTYANLVAFARALTDALIAYCNLYFTSSISTLCRL